MTNLTKYNTFKIISSLITVGTPLVTTALCSDYFVKSTDASISLAGVVGILLASLFMKEKLAEQFKTPTALKVSVCILVMIIVLESILIPIKTILIATCVACGVDELFVKRIYKTAEILLPEKSKAYKHFGFIFCKSSTLEVDNESNR